MNRKAIVGTILLGLSLPVLADKNLVPYVGADAKWNQMKFKNIAGGNVIAKNYPQGNFFTGLKFNECVGLEFGFQNTTEKSRKATVIPGDSLFGLKVPLGGAAVNVNTKTKIDGFNANIVGFYPIMEEYSLSLFGSVGVARLRLKTNSTFNAVGATENFTRNFVKKALVPRATLGLQSMLNECIGVRAMLTWEKTSVFKTIYVTEKESSAFIRPKDSKSLGLGVFYNFG